MDAAGLGPTVAARQSPSLTAFRFQSSAQRSLAVTVARDDQQAVLTANIEDARHRILMTSEGRTLVQARYAVRNSQRNFAQIALPAGAAVWSASVSGRPVRPGKAPDGSLLFPLAKGRAGEEAPVSVVEILYLVKGAPWEDRGKVALALPAVDLPVSRTGLLVYYPPTFRVTAEPGAFRTEAYQPPGGGLSGESSVAPAAALRPTQDLLQQLNQNAPLAGTHSGAPFAKKGGAELSLPGMHIPIGLLNWEVFLPEQYKVQNFGGDALPAGLFPQTVAEATDEKTINDSESNSLALGAWTAGGEVDLANMFPGQLGGHVMDKSGAVVPGVHVTVRVMATGLNMNADTDRAARWLVNGVPAGKVSITASAPGLQTFELQNVPYDPSRPSRYDLVLQVATTKEQIEIVGAAPPPPAGYSREQEKENIAAQLAPSTNVMNLQQRVAGALPIRVDVPHEGTSYRFVRPLVLNEETTVTFTYRKK